TDLQHGLGQTQPVRAILRSDDGKLADELQPAAKIIAGKGRIDVAAQRGGVAGDLAGFRLDLAFQLDRGIAEIIALKRLLGGCIERERDGQDRKRQKASERGDDTGADKREHGWISLPAGHHRAGTSTVTPKGVPVMTTSRAIRDRRTVEAGSR